MATSTWLLVVEAILLLATCQGSLILHPSTDTVVYAVGATVSFTCFSIRNEPIIPVHWQINGQLTTDCNGTCITEPLSQEIGRLVIFNLTSEYNMSRIRCEAHPAGLPQTTDSVQLILQGLLDGVRELRGNAVNTTIALLWQPPFSLNISGLDPDITYCVDVVSSTSSATLHSECGITVTEFTYPLPPNSGCVVYNFTVTPVNIVGNGTRETVILSGAQSHLVDTIQAFNNYALIMSAPVCRAKLSFVDNDTREVITLGDTALIIVETNITFTTQQLRQNRRYTVTVTASNRRGHATSRASISTHGIANVIIGYDSQSRIQIKTNYSNHSTSMGALFCFNFVGDNQIVDFSKSDFLALGVNSSHNYTLPNELHPGSYVVFVYDIEKNGYFHSNVSYPAHIIPLSLFSGNGQPVEGSKNNRNCRITRNSNRITAECDFLQTSSAGMQIIAQQRNLDEVHKLYTNKTTGPQSSSSVEVMVEDDDGLYQVAIYAIRDDTGIVDSEVNYTGTLEDYSHEQMYTGVSSPSHYSDLSVLQSFSFTVPSVADVNRACVGVLLAAGVTIALF